MKNLNVTFLKVLIIIALAPAVLAIAVANPLLGIPVLLIALSVLLPNFRPLGWTGAAFSRAFGGLFNAIGAVVGGFFQLIGAIVVGLFRLLTFGWVPGGRRGARFLRGWDHWKLLSRYHKGLLVDGHRYRLTEKASFESVLTIGGMGRGKSSTFVIPNLLTLDDCSFVISDTSGELYTRTSGALARRGYQIRVLNLIDPTRSETYNPLVNAATFTEIGQVAEIIIRSALQGGQNDRFWNSGAEKILRILIQCLRNNGDPAFMNLANVKHLLTNFDSHLVPPGQLGKLDQFIHGATQNDPTTWADYRGFVNGNQKTMLSFLTTADTALNALGNPQIASLTATSSIDFGELRRRKTALYVIVRQQDMVYYQFLLNLFYTDLFGQLLGNLQNAKRPVYLMLDEFGHLQIPNFLTFATTARKYRVGFWIFLQSLSQLEARYGRHDAATILNGLQTEIYLPGQSLETARQLEARLGRLAGTGNTAGQPLMSADEIIRMKDDRALLLHSNKRPALIRAKPYFRQGWMKREGKRTAIALPVSSNGKASLLPL